MRSVLALLVLNANLVVQMDSLIDELWGTEPPRSAVTTVQTYIYHLRLFFAAEGLDQSGQLSLTTRQPGYLLRLDKEQLDAELFERAIKEGRQLLENDQPAAAAALISEALDMWTGPALADVQCGDMLRANAIRLEERRINAHELKIEAEIRLGRHRELVAELRSLVHAHPLNEWFHGQLIRVLGYSGRRSEALQAYQRLRAVLREELGVDPSPSVQELQRRLLTAGVLEQRATRGLPIPA
jgi:DNA-binding SARP family transcriptional activator